MERHLEKLESVVGRIGKYSNVQILDCLTYGRNRQLQFAYSRLDRDFRERDRAKLQHILSVFEGCGSASAEPFWRFDCIDKNRCVQKQTHA